MILVQKMPHLSTKLHPLQLLAQKNTLFGTELPAAEVPGAGNAQFEHRILILMSEWVFPGAVTGLRTMQIHPGMDICKNFVPLQNN